MSDDALTLFKTPVHQTLTFEAFHADNLQVPQFLGHDLKAELVRISFDSLQEIVQANKLQPPSILLAERDAPSNPTSTIGKQEVTWKSVENIGSANAAIDKRNLPEPLNLSVMLAFR